jgi:DNA-binding XRE family transcriptional regulator
LRVAEREVETSQRAPMVRIGATKAGRAAVQVLSAGAGSHKKGQLGGPWQAELRQGFAEGERRGWTQLVFDGKPRPIQMHLELENTDRIDRALIHGILEEMREDGLRDFLVLQRMAAEQGATGRFAWTWEDHRDRTIYARRLAQKHVNADELAQAVVWRLQRLQRTELRWYADKVGADGSRPWVRIGPFGLIDIPAGVDTLTKNGPRMTQAIIEHNPVIYEGARRESKNNCFLLVPEEALELPGPELALYTQIAYRWHDRRDESAAGIAIKAMDLWACAGIRDGRATQRKRWPEATKTVERMLDLFGKRGLISNWKRDGAPGPAAIYRPIPPAPWLDRVVLGVPPKYGPTLAGIPRDGPELKAWREAKGLSQAELARRTGLAQGTLSKAEAKKVTLSTAIVTALRAYSER